MIELERGMCEWGGEDGCLHTAGEDVVEISHADGGQLDVAVDVEAVVFAGQHHGAVVHQGHVEALGVLDFGLQGR